MPCEVRSPGQVKWPNYKITFQSRHGYYVSGKVMKLSEYDEVTSAYKTYISDFWYRWPKVRSFLRPPHYKSMGKKSTLLYLLWRKPIWVESYRIGQLWTISFFLNWHLCRTSYKRWRSFGFVWDWGDAKVCVDAMDLLRFKLYYNFDKITLLGFVVDASEAGVDLTSK